MKRNELQVFPHQEFGQIRTIVIDGNVWFVASDIAKALGYKDATNAIKSHCRWVAKHHLPHPQSQSKTLEVNIIPEGDLYRLITHSELPNANKFEAWVFDEVLPTISKTGTYSTSEKIKQKASSGKPSLSSVNTAANTIMKAYGLAGVDPKFTAVAVNNLYREQAGISLPNTIQMQGGSYK